jgi:hypothetical protein
MELKEIVRALIEVARHAHNALDDGEAMPDGTHRIGPTDTENLIAALDVLEQLPDDKPGYTLEGHGPAKAEWALRGLLDGHLLVIDPDAPRARAVPEFLMASSSQVHPYMGLPSMQAQLADLFQVAVDAEFPMPDSPHASVVQRAVDNRAAMWRGINAARRILAPVSAQQGAAVDALREMVRWFGKYPEFVPAVDCFDKYKAAIRNAEAILGAAKAPAAQAVDARELLADIKRLVKLADDVGRSRQSNSYAMNSGAVEKLVDLQASVGARIGALAASPASTPEAGQAVPVVFMGIDPLNITKGAALPMTPESWRMGFYKSGDELRFGFLDKGALVAWNAVAPEQHQDADTGKTLMGLRMVIDDSLPHGVAEFRSGRRVVRVENIGNMPQGVLMRADGGGELRPAGYKPCSCGGWESEGNAFHELGCAAVRQDPVADTMDHAQLQALGKQQEGGAA